MNQKDNFWPDMGRWMVGEIKVKPRKQTPKHAATKPHRDKTKYDRKRAKCLCDKRR